MCFYKGRPVRPPYIYREGALLALLVVLQRNQGVGRVQELGKLARLAHVGDDVAAADKLVVHVELRNSRPLGVLLDALSELGVLQHVVGRKLRRVDALLAQQLDRGSREPTRRRLGRALHEEHHWCRVHGLVNGLAGLLRQKPQLLAQHALAEGKRRPDRGAGTYGLGQHLETGRKHVCGGM